MSRAIIYAGTTLMLGATSFLLGVSNCQRAKNENIEKTQYECKAKPAYKNVITGIATFGTQDMLFLSDIKTDEEKIYFFHGRPWYFGDLRLGDTVEVRPTVNSYLTGELYQDQNILLPSLFNIVVAPDSVFTRHNR